MKFSQLPNEMLSAIVKRLPIGDLRQVGSVCRRLYNVQQSLLPSALSSVKSLRIDIEPSTRTLSILEADFYRINERHGVMVKFGQDVLNRSIYDLVVTKDSVHSLVTWFPNIKRLTIVVDRCRLDLSGLLFFWPNLTALTIVGCQYVFEHSLVELAYLINKLKSLKSLVLDVALIKVVSCLSVCAHLEQLTCKLYDRHASPIRYKFERYVQAITETMTHHPNIKTMGLWLEHGYGYVDYSNWPSQVTNRITRLVHLDCARPAQSTLDVICDKFSSLTYLHFRSYKENALTLASALPSLSKLHHLQVLHLTIKGEPPVKASNLPRLKSVKRVTFLTPLDPHHLVAFDAFFPSALRVGLMVDISQWSTLREQLCHKANCANCTFLRRHCANVFSPHVEQIIQVWLD